MAVAMLLAGLGLLALFPWASKDDTVLGWQYAGVVAVAIACTHLYPHVTINGVRTTWRIGLLAAACLGIFLLGNRFGMRQFGGYDHSILIENAWLQYAGWIPNRDFICPFPPLFNLGSRLAFTLAGPGWRALVLANSLLAVALFLWEFSLLRRLTRDDGLALLGALAGQASTSLMLGYWWYNQIAAHASACLFLALTLALRAPAGKRPWMSVAMAVGLVLTNKANGWPMLLLVLPFLAMRRTRKFAWLACLTAGLGAWALLFAQGQSLGPFLALTLRLAKGRGSLTNPIGFLDQPPVQILATSLLLGLCWAFFLFRMTRWRPRPPWLEILLRLGALGTATLFFLSNAELKLLDLWPALAEMLVPSVGAESAPRRLVPSPIPVFACCVALAGGIFWGSNRLRVLHIGPRKFFEYDLREEALPLPFFRGLRTGPRFYQVCHDMQQAVALSQGKPVFFGPRIEFGYAALNLHPPPVGLPLFWQPGTGYPMGTDVAELIRRWEACRFDRIVLLRRDVTYLPAGLLAIIQRDYHPLTGWKTLDVWERNQEAKGTASPDGH